VRREPLDAAPARFSYWVSEDSKDGYT